MFGLRDELFIGLCMASILVLTAVITTIIKYRNKKRNIPKRENKKCTKTNEYEFMDECQDYKKINNNKVNNNVTNNLNNKNEPIKNSIQSNIESFLTEKSCVKCKTLLFFIYILVAAIVLSLLTK